MLALPAHVQMDKYDQIIAFSYFILRYFYTTMKYVSNI